MSAVKTTTPDRISIPRDPNSLGPAIHPGEMLLEEFLKPLSLKQNEVALQLGISVNRLNEIILGKRGMTADTALRLEDRFRMPAQFWMHLQADWDLQMAVKARRARAGSEQSAPGRVAARAQGRKDRPAAKSAHRLSARPSRTGV